MSRRKSTKSRKSFFYKILVLLILAGFATFLYCQDQNATPIEAVKYLFGQTELEKLPDMLQLPELPHFQQQVDFGLSQESPAPTPAPSLSPTPAASFPQGEILQNSGMHVYILDVGQGNCAFIRSPGGYTMLIDTGESNYYATVEAFLLEQGVERLDVVVATHPHSDHIGSMAKVIHNFEIGAFYMPEQGHTTAVYESMLEALEAEEVAVYSAYGGLDSTIPWDPLTTVSILSPFKGVEYTELNDISAVLRIAYGDTSIILPGDAEEYAQEVMLAKLPLSAFPSSVLCMPHHGGANAASDAFLAAVSPSIALISVGAGNDFGHPEEEVLNMLSRAGIPYYRTDENGTLHILLNGKKIQVETEK